MPPSEMTPAELRREVQAAALFFAAEWHRRECPAAGEPQRTTWAARHWRKFTDRAFDFLAIRAALEEKERGILAPAKD